MYCSLFLAAAGHIMFTIMINRVYDRITSSFNRGDVCRIRLSEGETVRYDTWRSLQGYKRMLKPTNIVIGIAIAALAVLLAIASIGSRIASSPIPATTLSIVYTIAVLTLVFLIVDIALANTLQAKIKGENTRYQSSMDTIIAAIKVVDKAYPIYREGGKNVYPESARRLYDIILKRSASFNNSDITLEDSKSTLINHSQNGNYLALFSLFKFDSTLDDSRLLQDAYRKASARLRTDLNMDKLKDALSVLQYYKPREQYTAFRNTLRSYTIYTYVVLFLFAMPLFHAVYNTLGAIFIGSFTIAIAMLIIFKQFFA